MDSSIIENNIRQKLTEIESREQVRIICCVESGSRAWGFASPDSDYDARFIYVRRPEFYLRLGKTRDVIEWQLDDVYDINGWDLQKTLRLLHGSNPTLFEWLGSPIVYRTSDDLQKLAEVSKAYFNAYGSVRHYMSMAHNNLKAYLGGETVKLKKYFYVIRPILAARWVIDNGTPPPVLFSELVEAEPEPALKGVIGELLERKKQTSELGKAAHIAELDEYIEKSLSELLERAERITPTGIKDWEPLDELFLEMIGKPK